MNTSSIEAVIFDCDGTLVDSEPITTRVLVEYVAEFGLVLNTEEAIGCFAGRDLAGIMREFERILERPLPADFIDQFRSRQAVALEDGVEAIEGAIEVLESMSLPMVLASNAPREKIEINLRVSGLESYFTEDRIFSAYDIQVWKPAPDLFLHATKTIGVHPANCAVVEDSPAGFEAAARAGTRVFCYEPATRESIGPDSPMLEGAASVHFISQLVELKAFFDGSLAD